MRRESAALEPISKSQGYLCGSEMRSKSAADAPSGCRLRRRTHIGLSATQLGEQAELPRTNGEHQGVAGARLLIEALVFFGQRIQLFCQLAHALLKHGVGAR